MPVPDRRNLLQRFPLQQVEVAGEQLTSPYHVYDGSMALIGGTCDPESAAMLLDELPLVPLRDVGGRALMAVWIADFSDANLGPHHELQISVLATAEPAPPQPASPWAMHRALAAIPQTRVVCHGLWNSTDRVVAYNAEHLRLDAHRAGADVAFRGPTWRFCFADQGGKPLADGAIQQPGRTRPGELVDMVKAIGIRDWWRLVSSPATHVKVASTRIGPEGSVLVADTYTRARRTSLRAVAAGDEIALRVSPYADADFRPAFVQQLTGVQFAYLRPRAEQPV